MEEPAGLIAFLKPYVSEHRKQLIADVLSKRTRYLTVVLENIYHPHNASAVIRSCDCFGVQDVHIIEGRNKYTINPYVVRGSAKWISLAKYLQTEGNCFYQLKAQGYTLVGTSPNPAHKPLNQIDVSQKIALVFGTEETGLSVYATKLMDDFVHIPMVGFTESFNISVSAAICLYEITQKIRFKNIDWQLSALEKDTLTLEWYKNSIAKSEALECEYLRINNISNYS